MGQPYPFFDFNIDPYSFTSTKGHIVAIGTPEMHISFSSNDANRDNYTGFIGIEIESTIILNHCD